MGLRMRAAIFVPFQLVLLTGRQCDEGFGLEVTRRGAVTSRADASSIGSNSDGQVSRAA